MKYYLQILTIFFTHHLFACAWQQHWHQGHEFFSKEQFQEAANEFDQAVNVMTEEDQDKHPYVLADRSENWFCLQNYPQVMLDTQMALKSANLTEQERLNCGMRRISVFMILGEEDAAIEEYKKYIIGCSLFPKYIFSDEKIIIRNIPDCVCYKNSAKDLMLSLFCESENDICEYDNLWIINITKKCKCDKENGNETELPIRNLSTSVRTEQQIEACCNTVNRLAVAANVICGCLSIPTGPVSSVACKVACAVIIEAIRETAEWCCYNGGVEEKCWKKFETWKVAYKKANPDCPKPPTDCNKKR